MTRRELVIVPAVSTLLRRALADVPSEAQNLSYPLEAIQSSLTPPDLFFVRDHFSEPELSLREWKLQIEGRVAHPLQFSFADLLESPTRKIEAVLECAGNTAGGPAVSNAVWEGVPLQYLLRQAGPTAGAATVMLEGADSGRLMQDSSHLPYCQVVPMSKCMRDESLVAFKLNDTFLPRKNGFPARALFPGWYAMDSVKWLQRIVVLGTEDEAAPFRQSGMNKVYNRITEVAPGNRAVTRLSEIAVKSAIAWPRDKAQLPAGRYTVRGFAWTGGGVIRKVEVSPDGGRTWMMAKLESVPKAHAWVRWTYSWTAPAGERVLMSRATDDAGHSQPLHREPGRKDAYEMNLCGLVRCSVL